ncbi:unnamed protein product [Mortierella alpina]
MLSWSCATFIAQRHRLLRRGITQRSEMSTAHKLVGCEQTKNSIEGGTIAPGFSPEMQLIGALARARGGSILGWS